jgi:outer membrane protein assembly factor BamB
MNTVFFGSADGFVYCLNSMSGALIWKYPAGGGVSASPTIDSNGVLYVGSGVGATGRATFLAINSQTGTLSWYHTFTAAVVSAAAIGSNGTIFVGSYDFNMYSFNPQGQVLWKYFTGDRKLLI